jgi:pimeloyl-ACP methyl ester carboxylesterase
VINPHDPFGRPPHTTLAFWQSGERLCLHDRPLAIDCPVRLIHGQADDVVPWQLALKTAAQLRSADVQTILVKDGDHRLSRAPDLRLLCGTVASLIA